MRVGISWFGLVALVALLYVLVSGLANPRTRPFVIGLGVVVGLGSFFLFFARTAAVRVEESQRAATISRAAHEVIKVAPAPSPPKSSASETKRPKMPLIVALRQAVVQGWTNRNLPPVAEAPEKPAKIARPDPPAKPQPPAWVNAAPTMENGCYMASVWVGPFTTSLECERKLPSAVQTAVTEYAELSLGPQAAAVRLPNEDLEMLVRERWTEIRPMEIGGGSQEMVSLHAQVVFDADMQQRIKSAAEQLVIERRVQSAAVAGGGVLGLLALAWGGLRWATRRR